jgi:hypothetical protein
MARLVDREGPIHRACIDFLESVLPGAVVHHSPNEIPIAGKNIARAIAKAKWNGMKPGYPDIICHYADRTMLFEVKAEGNYQDKNQKAMAEKLEAQGIPYFVVRSQEDVAEALAELGIEHRGTINTGCGGK